MLTSLAAFDWLDLACALNDIMYVMWLQYSLPSSTRDHMRMPLLLELSAMHACATLAAAHVPEAHHLKTNLLFSQSFQNLYWWLLSSVPAPGSSVYPFWLAQV